MAQDSEKPVPEDDELEEVEAEELVSDPERPPCPRCGWHNTRLSHTKTVMDTVLRAFSFRAFRCRSCGNRFRSVRRAKKA
ncbi:MAG: hypothetical protein ABI806_21085 [Candidatus Solibacter sp.]